MKNVLNIFWNPDKNIVEGFKYGTFVLLAVLLLLSFILPLQLILTIFLCFFILRAIVLLRAAATHKIDEEKLEKYSGDNSIVRRSYIANYTVLSACLAVIIFFYLVTDGLLGLILTLIIAAASLPSVLEEIVIIKRCQSNHSL